MPNPAAPAGSIPSDFKRAAIAALTKKIAGYALCACASSWSDEAKHKRYKIDIKTIGRFFKIFLH